MGTYDADEEDEAEEGGVDTAESGLLHGGGVEVRWRRKSLRELGTLGCVNSG